MAWTQKEDAYLRKCMKDGIKMTEAARVLGKGYESVVKRRQMLLAGSYDAITYNPRVEVTPCSDSSLIIEMVEWLFELGYRPDVADLVRHRLDRLARSVDEAWWRSRVERWTLAEWVERLSTAGAGAL